MHRIAMINFPFSAVQGQQLFKLALTLCAINPAIGGVLVSGPRGSAKSTLARGLADVLPGNEKHAFVTLPLGATEEMLIGTLDLEKVLANKEVCFTPGLLSKAHQGVLYVDEVNLLTDTLVDLLLDVSASGVNHVERDGISHQHEARFVLLGTMNPDEGELRPQLQDRFGLAVQLSNQYTKQERIDIVSLREAFDDNPSEFIESYKAQQQVIVEAVQLARSARRSITVSDACRGEIAERCEAANVDGLRADIVWLRAAIAHAALHKRHAISVDDIDAVEELVLSHRRKDNSPQGSQKTPPQTPFSNPNKPSTEQNEQPQSSDGDWGSMQPQAQLTARSMADDIDCRLVDTVLNKSQQTIPFPTQKKGRTPDATKRQSGSKREGRSINWFSTLIANTEQWPLQKFLFRQPKKGQVIVHMVLLDTSASTLYANGFAKAKAAVLNIAEQAYLQREQLAILGFGNEKVDWLLPSVRAPKVLRGCLDEITAAGGTPLRDGLYEARRYQQELIRKVAGVKIKNYLITDGKTSDSLQGVQLLGETLIIDLEQSAVKRGNGRKIADQLGAQYSALWA